jgi:uncharacterized membrane protein YkvA (DUF1232 family)
MPTSKRRNGPRKSQSKPTASTPHSPMKLQKPPLEVSDIRRIVLDAANQIAPADVVTLMAREQEFRARADDLATMGMTLFRDQLDLAFDCLKDHVSGASPQIPYFTISLLAAAVCYFGDVLDAIPDFLPNIGELDDAAVMAMACQLGADGLRRYCTWKGRSADLVLSAPSLPRRDTLKL